MNYRYATVLAEKALAGAGTETIDLNLQDPISRIEIGYHVTLADTAMLAALVSPIIKVELVDGSDVLHSLSGVENQALCIYDRRVPTMNHAELIMGADCYATLGIDFGRFLYDPELAFDPTKFRNPQLKITHNRLLVGATTATHLIEVFAHCFDEKVISPVGFLMSKEHKAYTLGAAAAYEYTDLPTDFPIRQMIIRAYLTQEGPKNIVDTIKLSEDNDKRIPIDCGLEAYIRRMKGVWPLLQEGCTEYGHGAGTYDKYVTPTDHMTAYMGMGIGGTNVPYLGDYIKGGFVQRLCSVGAMMVLGFVTGYLPHHCIQFPFGRQDDLDDWYDVTKVGSLKLRLLSKAAGSGGTVGVILQQLRRY